MVATLALMSHILPGRAQVTSHRDKRTLLQFDAYGLSRVLRYFCYQIATLW